MGDITSYDLLMLVPAYLVFLFSFVVHESAHAWMSCKLGDGTARYYVSLNPIPHIKRTPFGMVVVPLLTYFFIGWPLGFASVPVNYLWAQQNPKRFGLVALAGPVSNILLAIGFVFILGLNLVLVTKFGLWNGQANMIYEVLRLAVNLNVVLAVFNLIPVPPLDGSSIPCLFIPLRHMKSYLNIVWNPSMALPGMLIAYFAFAGIFRTIGIPLLLMLDSVLNLFKGFL